METMNISLKAALTRIMVHGPDRVVVNQDGEATSSKKAREQYGINPDIIFIREDGWSLGAPWQFENVAWGLWAKEWIGFIRKGGTVPLPMSDYFVKSYYCVVHPDRPAASAFNIPCAPGGKVHVCAECADKSNPEILRRVFEAYQAQHGKRITAFKQENPNS